MFYRIKDDRIYDYADYKYNEECLETDIITQKELQEHPQKVIIGEKEIEIEVPDFEIHDIEVEIHDVDENGEYIYDEDGNPITHIETRPVQEPVMIEYEDTETVIDYDEEGNPTGSHEITVIKTKQKTHIETKIIKILVLNPEWEEIELAEAKKNKYDEALQKAYLFQQEGTVEYKNCVFEMSDSNRKNLSDTEEALKLMGEDSTVWNDKDDNLITLTVKDIQYIRLNLILATIQKLWIEQYPTYKAQIEKAETVEEVNAIEIDYTEV